MRVSLRRTAALAAGLGAIALAYVLITMTTMGLPPPDEQQFERHAGDAGPALWAYLDIQSFDPMRSELQGQLDFSTTAGMFGHRFGDPIALDAVVIVADGAFERHIRLRRDEPVSPVPIGVDLNRGRVDGYPFDHYRAEVMISARDGIDLGKRLPLKVTVWSQHAAWRYDIAPAAQGLDGDSIDLDITVRRPNQVRFFAVTLYTAMGVVGCIALTIGVLVFLRLRRADTTLASVLSGMMFALPVMRSIMPGSPPLGVRADILVFLWAEVAVVIALMLVVVTWARHGEKAAR